jgi:hypothetical protein
VEQIGSSRAKMVALTRRVGQTWRLVEAHISALPEASAP